MTSIVLVSGPAWSGTTMLHLMLANADDAWACGELAALSRPWKTHHFRPQCTCGRDYENCLWSRFDRVKPKHVHRRLAEELGAEWLIDHSKNLHWILDSQRWARKNRIKIYNVLMIKEPVDYMYSSWKRGRSVLKVKTQYYRYYQSYFALGIPFVSVRLSELTTQPAQKLARLCRIIDMPYFPGKEKFWEKRHCNLFGNLGLRNQLESGNASIVEDHDFPQEFHDSLGSALEEINSDPVVARVRDRILEREVDVVSGYEDAAQCPPVRKPPAWYYAHRLTNMYRRLFPKR